MVHLLNMADGGVMGIDVKDHNGNVLVMSKVGY